MFGGSKLQASGFQKGPVVVVVVVVVGVVAVVAVVAVVVVGVAVAVAVVVRQESNVLFPGALPLASAGVGGYLHSTLPQDACTYMYLVLT